MQRLGEFSLKCPTALIKYNNCARFAAVFFCGEKYGGKVGKIKKKDRFRGPVRGNYVFLTNITLS